MRFARGLALAPLTTMSLCACCATAFAQLDVSGGVRAPSSPLAGGSEYGAAAVFAQRPVVSRLSVPAHANAGRPPRVQLQIDEAAVATVDAQVSVISLSTHKAVITVRMGWVRTGRILTVSWPLGASLRAGGYQVNLSAHDHYGGMLLGGAHAAREARLTIS